MVVAVGQSLGKAFSIVGALDPITEQFETLPALGGNVILHAHQEAHGRGMVLFRSSDMGTAAGFVRAARPSDRAVGSGKAVQAAEQAPELVLDRGRVGTATLDEPE